MHAELLLAPSTRAVHRASSALTRTLPVLFLVNLRTHGFVQVPQVRGWQRSLINACAMFMIMRLPPSNLNSANIFFDAWFGAKLPNLNSTNISGYPVYGIEQSSNVADSQLLIS